MYLTVGATGVGDEKKFDLDKIYDDHRVVDEGTYHVALLLEIARWALEEGVSLEDTHPLYIFDAQMWDDDSTLKVDAGNGEGAWHLEVAKLAWYLKQQYDTDRQFAYLSQNHWKYIDFDDLDTEFDDNYSDEFNGDYSEYAIEWMSNSGESIPDHLEPYFDFEEYGKSLIEGMVEYEWNGCTYLYHQ